MDQKLSPYLSSKPSIVAFRYAFSLGALVRDHWLSFLHSNANKKKGSLIREMILEMKGFSRFSNILDTIL